MIPKSNLREEIFIRDFLELNLGEKLERTKVISQKYGLFQKNIVEVIDKNAPLKTLIKKRSQKPEKAIDHKRNSNLHK